MPPCSEKTTLTGTCKLKGYLNLETDTLHLNPNTDDRGVVLTFKDAEKAGTIVGHTVSNEVYGTYTLLEGCLVDFSGFGGTKRGENEWSGKVWALMQGKADYSVIGQTLNLDFYELKTRMVFVKN